MKKRIIIKLFIVLIFFSSNLFAEKLQKCKWNNKKDISCLTISKTSNTSAYSIQGINKIIISKQDIINSGAIDINDVLNMVPGLDLKQNGQRGQLTSLFMRGTNSNHTLVLLNGIAINDQSTTQGLHNFGQDFVQTIQQIEIYKGPNGSHFGPSAIGGAINFITAIDYQNNFSINGFDQNNNSISGNYAKITENGWRYNLIGSTTGSKTDSAKYGGNEYDGTKNHQINFNSEKWINDNLKFRSTLYLRKTKSDYDESSTDESGYIANDKIYVIQTGLDRFKKNTEDTLTFHYNNYDRDYENGGYIDEFLSESFVVKAERRIKKTNRISFGLGSDYKYDWASFVDNGSWSTPSAKGNLENLGFFGNIGYKFSENTILSLYGRIDEHKTTGITPTYKINFKKLINKFDLSLTHSTGLRNPSLYELYGHNGRTDSYKHVANPKAKSEKSSTNELIIQYNFLENISIKTTAYRTSIKDALLYDSNFNGGTGYTNTIKDLIQDGIETDFTLKGKNQNLSLFNTISSSKQSDGSHQLNRPDSTYGAKFYKKFRTNLFGSFNINYSYKHYGKVFDYAPGIKKVDSSDIMDLSLTKKMFNNLWSINISNLLNEKYQRPQGYNQEGRQIRIGFKKSY